MIQDNLSLRAKAHRLLILLRENPEMLVGITKDRNPTELTKKPKVGEKVHSGKRSFNHPIDYEAADLKTDLMIALEANDHEEITRNYYALAALINY